MSRQSDMTPKMRISFDLDEVLFVSPKTHKTEPPLRFPLSKIYTERLRLGTAKLIPELQRLGYEVWVYTTSYRSDSYIRRLFGHYGIRFDGIVNGQRHAKEVQGNHPYPMPTKLPSFYQITLHIDDEAIVASYGRTYGFEVFELDAPDDAWAEKIIERADAIRHRKFS